MTMFRVIGKDPQGKKTTKVVKGHKKSLVETLMAQGYKLIEVRKIEERRYA
jgi:type II secretory pathway component PulF